jgi:hypothetical protein
MRLPWTPTGLRGFANVAVPWLVGIFGVLVALGEGDNGAPSGVVLLLLALAVVQGVAMRWRRTHPIPVTAVALVTGLAVLAISPDSVMPVAGYFAVGALASVLPRRIRSQGRDLGHEDDRRRARFDHQATRAGRLLALRPDALRLLLPLPPGQRLQPRAR